MKNIFKDIGLFKDKLNECKDIYLTAHVNPDGDSVGSMLALAGFLKSELNKNVQILVNGKISSSFKFMPGIDRIISDTSAIDNIDLLITLDSADIDRLALEKRLVKNAKHIVNIDHHITNTNFGHTNFVDGSSSSTGEVLYEMMKLIGGDITRDVATCLYVSISTDTGSFKYTNTTSRTHDIASKLLEKNIDLETINIELYQNRSLEETKLLMESIKHLTLLENDTVGIVAIDNDILEASNAEIQDTGLIVDFIRNIDVVNIACLIRPIDENSSKASLRSKKDVDVSKIVAAFGGGGHAKAAGCTIHSNVAEAKKKITEEILRYLGD